MGSSSKFALRTRLVLRSALVGSVLCAGALPALAQDRPGQAPLPIVQGIRIEGEQRYTEAQIASVLGQELGRELDPVALDRGVQRLWSSFHVRAEPKANTVAGGIDLVVYVHEMPVDREPRFIGNESIDEKTLREWALLEDKSELYLHQAGRVRQRILENYRREGYYFAEVNVLTRDGGDVVPDVIFEIREGRRVRVKGIEIAGNASMPDTRFLYFFRNGLSSLSDRQLESPWLFNWTGSKFDPEVLDADLLAMRNVYRDRGWLDAVVELDRLEFNDDHSEVVVHVVVDEGPRYTVSSLAIRGVEWDASARNAEPRSVELVYPEAELRALCKLAPGQVYERVTRERDAAALRGYYGSRGRIAHRSLPREVGWSFEEPELAFDTEQHTVAVTYRLAQGRELKIREILINGNTHTQDRVVRRELSAFPGEIADLKEIERSLTRITASGYFTDPMARALRNDPSFQFRMVEGDPSQVDLDFLVEEGRVIDFNISGGVNSDNGLFLLLSLQMRNFDISDTPDSFLGAFGEIARKEAFHGAGQTVQLEASPGTVYSRYRLRFLEPDLFRSHLEPVGLDLDVAKSDRVYRTHDESRSSYKARLGRMLGFDWRVWLGYVLHEIEITDLDNDGVPLALDFQESEGHRNHAGVTFDVTTRSVDNSYVPHEGYSFGWSNVFYSSDVGGDYDITTTELGGDLYIPTFEKDDGTRSVLHLELNFGAQQPYGDTSSTPYTERYYLGGTRSLRGFRYRGVGPTDLFTDEPLGGETELYGTVEWFYPLNSYTQPGSYRPIETVRLGVFFDYGVLGVDSWDVDLSQTRSSAGFSIGLVYPMPFVFNFGYPLRDFEGDDRQTFTFTIQSR